MINKQDIINSATNLGLKKGDTVLIHSSFKSLGPVENGASDVIDGFMSVLTGDGTLVMPTFVQKDFANAYETWHLDKPSDTGYLTEFLSTRFPILPGLCVAWQKGTIWEHPHRQRLGLMLRIVRCSPCLIC